MDAAAAPIYETYAESLPETARALFHALAAQVAAGLHGADVRIWHGAPVWFDEGTPFVGLTLTRRGVQLLFWSGQLFDEPALKPVGKFKASERVYQAIADIDPADLQRWLVKSRAIRWDYAGELKKRREAQSE
jgi:hypothetical protein